METDVNIIVREMLPCDFRTHVKNSVNRNYLLEIVYCLKYIILIFFNNFLPLIE